MEIRGEPIFDPDYPKVKPVYRAGEESEYDPRDQKILDFIAPWRGTRVFEPGAGDGRYTNPLLRQGNRVVAADLDLGALFALWALKIPAELLPGLQLIKMDLFHPSFINGSFDNLLCTGTLYVFPPERLEGVFPEFARVLKPDGKLVLDFLTERHTESLSDDPLEGESLYQYSYKQGREILQGLLASQFNIKKITETLIDVMLTGEGTHYRLTGRKINVFAQRI